MLDKEFPTFNISYTVGNGWEKILWKLCEDIRNENPSDFHFTNIKEKFGLLRIYTNNNNDKIAKLIRQAEEESGKVCEECGSTENVTTRGNSWIKTLCDKCRKIGEN